MSRVTRDCPKRLISTYVDSQGIPNLSSHSVEEFLYLFELNHEGQIERQEFINEAQHLGVLSHG